MQKGSDILTIYQPVFDCIFLNDITSSLLVCLHRRIVSSHLAVE